MYSVYKADIAQSVLALLDFIADFTTFDDLPLVPLNTSFFGSSSPILILFQARYRPDAFLKQCVSDFNKHFAGLKNNHPKPHLCRNSLLGI